MGYKPMTKIMFSGLSSCFPQNMLNTPGASLTRSRNTCHCLPSLLELSLSVEVGEVVIMMMVVIKSAIFLADPVTRPLSILRLRRRYILGLV